MPTAAPCCAHSAVVEINGDAAQAGDARNAKAARAPRRPEFGIEGMQGDIRAVFAAYDGEDLISTLEGKPGATLSVARSRHHA